VKVVKETHRRSAGVFVLGVVAALVMGLGWALSSPVASGPDDDYHLGSIWCPRPVGESCSLRIVDGEEQVEVPRGVSPLAMQCFVKQKDAPAACGQVDAQTVVASPRYDTGNYPKGYYRFHHFFVGQDIERSVLVMRSVNVLIAVGLVAGIAALSPPRIRRAMALGMAASWFPMGVYFIASNNPSSWAMTGLFSFAVAVYCATQARSWRRWVLLGLAAFAALLCLASRYDAAFYLFIVAVALAFAVQWEPRRHRAEIALLIFTSVVGIYWMYSSTNPAAAPLNDAGAGGDTGGSSMEFSLPGLVWALASFPKYVGGFYGYHWTPGWGDVPTEEHAPFVFSIMAAGAILMVALSRGSWHKWLAGTVLLGAVAGLPVVFHATGIFPELVSYQARYVLPLLAVTFFVLLSQGLGRRPLFSQVQAGFLLLCFTGATVLTQYITMLRYVNGVNPGQPRVLSPAHGWWWTLPVHPLSVWGLTSLATFVFLTLMIRTGRQELQEEGA